MTTITDRFTTVWYSHSQSGLSTYVIDNAGPELRNNLELVVMDGAKPALPFPSIDSIILNDDEIFTKYSEAFDLAKVRHY